MSRNRSMSSSMNARDMRDRLIQRFADARIPLVWADSPLDFDARLRVDADNPLFMMDVRRQAGRTRTQEYILLHFGNGTEVQVVDADARQQQVVLRVYEPESTMQIREWDPRRREHVERDVRVRESKRSLLVGMDECHLFVCPLERNASSVAEAHRKLQPDAVRNTPRRSRGTRRSRRARTKRQGEWFFVPVDDAGVLQAIADVVDLAGPERRVPVALAAGARPHVVDERVRVGDAIYVRGRVRHPDHHVLKLNGWHAVHINTESREARIEGMTWVD